MGRGVIYLMWNLHRIFSLFRCPWGKRRMKDVSYLYDRLSSKMSMCFEESRAVGIFMVGCTSWTLGPAVGVHFLISFSQLWEGRYNHTIEGHSYEICPWACSFSRFKKNNDLNPDLCGSEVSALLYTHRERDFTVVRMFPFL